MIKELLLEIVIVLRSQKGSSTEELITGNCFFFLF